MALRTIQAPGIQVNEIDRSQYDNVTDYSMPDSPYCYIAGFADKGDDYAIHAFTRREDFIARYGYPQNEAERYFYNGCLEVIDNGGKLLASKLPYDNNSKDKYAYVDYKIDPNLYPIMTDSQIVGKWSTVNDIRDVLLQVINDSTLSAALSNDEIVYDLSGDWTLPAMLSIVNMIFDNPAFSYIKEQYNSYDIMNQQNVITAFTNATTGLVSYAENEQQEKANLQLDIVKNYCNITAQNNDLTFDDVFNICDVLDYCCNTPKKAHSDPSKNEYAFPPNSTGIDVTILVNAYKKFLESTYLDNNAKFSDVLKSSHLYTEIQTVNALRESIRRIVDALNDSRPYLDLRLNDSEITSCCRILPDIDENTGIARSGLISMDKLDDYLVNDYTDLNNKIRIVDIARNKYEQASFDSVMTYKTSSDGQKYGIYTNDCLGIVPVIVTPANALYFQSMIQEAHSKDYNCIANFNAIKPTDTDVANMLTRSIVLSNLYVDLMNGEDDLPTKETLSKIAADCFPQIEYENNLHYDKEHFKKIGIVVLSAFVDNANNKKLNFSVLESFVGSLDKTARSTSDNASIFIDNVVNNNSSYIRCFSNANIKTVQQASIIVLKNQTATSLGFYENDCIKNINVQESILTPLRKRILCNMEDTRGWQVDLVIDAGLTNIGQYLQGIDAEYSGLLSIQSRPQYWWTIANVFDQFCKFTRKDCIYLLDSPRPFCLEGSQKIVRRTKPTNTILDNIVPKLKHLTGINSSYSAGYCDWFKCKDQYNGDTFWCPPSIKAASAYIYTDVYYYPWNAPAGMNRGKLSNVLDTAFSPTNEEAGRLYTQCWNYAVNYPLDGIVIEGQRTFQRKATALDRVNVRRLMIWLEKKVVNVAKYYLYEGHTAYLREKFVNALTPIFEKAVNGYGISDYVIKCDEENNTSTTIDRNELHCNIAVKPIKAVEFIVLNFIVTNQTAEVTEEISKA